MILSGDLSAEGVPPDPWTMMDFEGHECKTYHIVDSPWENNGKQA